MNAAKLLSIVLPDQKVTKVNVNANTTVGEVCDILIKQVGATAQGEEFGIAMDEIVFDRNSKIAKIPAVYNSNSSFKFQQALINSTIILYTGQTHISKDYVFSKCANTKY
jgi:hypothetical protein